MKKYNVISLLLVSCISLIAQTNQLPPLPSINLPVITISGVSSNTATAVNDIGSWISPLTGFLTNHSITVDIAPIYGQGKFGGIADLRVPITTNFGSISLGVGGALADNQWFIGPISASIGTQITIPVINRPAYMFAAEGLSLGLKDDSLGSETTAGMVTSFDLSSTVQLNVEGGYVKITQLTGNDYFFGAGLVWHPKKW